MEVGGGTIFNGSGSAEGRVKRPTPWCGMRYGNHLDYYKCGAEVNMKFDWPWKGSKCENHFTVEPWGRIFANDGNNSVYILIL